MPTSQIVDSRIAPPCKVVVSMPIVYSLNDRDLNIAEVFLFSFFFYLLQQLGQNTMQLHDDVV